MVVKQSTAMGGPSMRLRGILFASALLTATVPAMASAQATTGTVRGIVRDSSAAVVPGATVRLTDPNTGYVGEATTSADGQFVLALIPPGLYAITAQARGFREAQVTARVVVAGVVSVGLSLTPSSVSETLVVNAAAPSVASMGVAVTTRIDLDLLQRLPSNNRHALQFARLAPGVDAFAGAGQIIGQDGSNAVVANGQRSTQNSFYLDGAENSGAWRNWALQFPNPDTVQEIQVQRANATSQFGKQPGAVVNVVTRSGSNQFRGTAFHFLHDERLNANLWVNNRNGFQKPEDNQRFTGGVLGGPVRRNSTFFFASVNRYRTEAAVTQTAGRFPTAALKRGDFTEVPDFVRADGTVVPFDLKDPVTGASLGKTIPASMLSPAAASLLPLLPTAAAYYDQAVRQFERPRAVDEYLLKVDQLVGSRQRLSGTLLVTRGSVTDPSHSFNNNNTPEWGAAQTRGRQTTGFVKHAWTRGAFALESRFAYAENTSDVRSTAQERGPADFGITFPFTPIFRVLPTILLDNEGGFRADHQQNDFIGQRNHRVGVTATWARAAHLFTFGTETQVDRVSFEGNRDLRLTFRFNGRDSLNGPIRSASQVPLAANNFGTQNFAYAFADFLLGRAATSATSGYGKASLASRSYYAFIQDEWQAHPNLTLSLGVRYELTGDVSERDGQLGGSFVLGHQSDQYPLAPAGLAWAGDAGVSPGIVPRDRNNLAPQAGLAWDIRGNGRTTLRAGLGLYNANIPLAGNIFMGTSGFGGASPAAANLLLHDPYGTSKVNPYDTAFQYGPENPVPDAVKGYTPATFPWASSFRTQNVRGVPTRAYVGTIVGHDPNLTTPYVVESHVTVERVLRPGLTVAAAYVGNRGFHQPMWAAFNAPVPTAGGDTSAQSVLDRRPNASYGGGRVFSTVLDTEYDALQVWTELKLGGLTALGSYVLARNVSPFGVGAQDVGKSSADGFTTGTMSAEAILDSSGNSGQGSYPYDIERDRAENGRRHVFKFHYVYDVPWGRGRRWLGGWAVSGAMVAMSGIPLNITWGMDANADSSAADRPNLVGQVAYGHELAAGSTLDRRGAVQYLDRANFIGPCNSNDRTGPAAFCAAAGNLPRNAARGVPVYNIDLAVLKSVGLGAMRRLELRFETYNLLNTNFLGTPTLDLSSPFFGQVLGRIHRPRQMQAALKLYF